MDDSHNGTQIVTMQRTSAPQRVYFHLLVRYTCSVWDR